MYDAAIHDVEKSGVDICVDAEKTIENIEEDLEYRMKKKLTIPDNVDDTAIDDNEKAGIEVCVDAKKTVKLRLLRKTWKTEQRRK